MNRPRLRIKPVDWSITLRKARIRRKALDEERVRRRSLRKKKLLVQKSHFEEKENGTTRNTIE